MTLLDQITDACTSLQIANNHNSAVNLRVQQLLKRLTVMDDAFLNPNASEADQKLAEQMIKARLGAINRLCSATNSYIAGVTGAIDQLEEAVEELCP